MSNEQAQKQAVMASSAGRAELVEGTPTEGHVTWAQQGTVATLREQLHDRVQELGCLMGSGFLDLPGSPNLFVPDLAVVPDALAASADTLTPGQTLLIVEVTDADASVDRDVKPHLYAAYGAPLFLLVDRDRRQLTLHEQPHPGGYQRVTAEAFGATVELPAPFGLTLVTDAL